MSLAGKWMELETIMLSEIKLNLEGQESCFLLYVVTREKKRKQRCGKSHKNQNGDQ